MKNDKELQIMQNNKIQVFEVFVSSGNFVTISNDDKSPINKELNENFDE